MTIYPSLRYHDARAAIDFLTEAFGFTELQAHADDDGVIRHAELAGFGGIVMLGTEPAGGDPLWGEHAGQSWLYLSTEDPDALHERAVSAGAQLVRELQDTDYGSREFSVRDPEGNIWSFGTYTPQGGAPAMSDDDLMGAEHVRAYRETGGARGYDWRGAKVLLLTTIGRRSGEPRTTPLIHGVDGDRWVIIASKGGAPDHPAWYLNLQSDPEVTIQVQADEIPVTATTAEGDDRSRLWAAMRDEWPAYDDYQAQTDREIPVVVLARR